MNTHKIFPPTWREKPETRRRNIFAYIDARDLGQMVDRCLAVDGLGYQIFNVSNDNHSVATSTSDLVDRFYKGVPLTRDIGEDETFYANFKAKKLLGFQPQHDWRKHLKP